MFHFAALGRAGGSGGRGEALLASPSLALRGSIRSHTRLNIGVFESGAPHLKFEVRFLDSVEQQQGLFQAQDPMI